MDTDAYLKRQGWRGDGHSLDNDGRGIRKPLLVSKKIDVLGLGVNKHAAVSDQWWMRAFDQSLKDLGTGKESALANVQKHGIHHGSLYGRFIKGESMAGTIGERAVQTSTTHPRPEEASVTSASSATKGTDPANAQGRVKHGRKKERAPKDVRKLEKAQRRHAKASKAIGTALDNLTPAQRQKAKRKYDRAVVKLQKAQRTMAKAHDKKDNGPKKTKKPAREQRREAVKKAKREKESG